MLVARGTRRPSGGSHEWRRWCVALEMVVVDGAAAGDGDGEDGWLGGTGWRTPHRHGRGGGRWWKGGVRGMEMPGPKGDRGCC